MSSSRTRKSSSDSIALRHALQWIEPWLIFLSILYILFVPFAKGLWWSILLGVALANAVRRWREAWTWFSLESMREMLRASLWVPGIVLLYFAMHSYAPQFVHVKPSTDPLNGDHRMVVDLRMPDGTVHRGAWLFLRVSQKRGRIDLFGEVHLEDDSARALFDFEGVASFGDYIRASLNRFRDRTSFRIKQSHTPWNQTQAKVTGSGWLGWNPNGKPLHLSLKTTQGLTIED